MLSSAQVRLTLPPRVLAGVVVLLTAISLVAAGTANDPASAQDGTADAEQAIAQLLAAERDRAGLGVAPRASQLDAVARDWARQQATDGQMGHNPSLRDQVQPARAWYENVGVIAGVPSATSYRDAGQRLHELWMGSDGHRANILRSPITDVGIGVAAAGDRIYATVVFRDHGGQVAQPAPPEPSPEPPADTGSVRASSTPSGSSGDAPSEAPAAPDPAPTTPAPEPEPTLEPAPVPEPEPEPTVEPEDVALELDRALGVGTDEDQVSASDARVLPLPEPSDPPEELRDDDVVALEVRDGGPGAVPLALGGLTVAGALLLSVARVRRARR